MSDVKTPDPGKSVRPPPVAYSDSPRMRGESE
jgi:hypothetical protein